MKFCLYFSLVSSVMFCGLAYGACTPSPDCSSLGYTATFCPNGGVKCPFDTSKWHCDNPKAPASFCCNDGTTECLYSSVTYEQCKKLGYADCKTMYNLCIRDGNAFSVLGCDTMGYDGFKGFLASKYECEILH